MLRIDIESLIIGTDRFLDRAGVGPLAEKVTVYVAPDLEQSFALLQSTPPRVISVHSNTRIQAPSTHGMLDQVASGLRALKFSRTNFSNRVFFIPSQ